MSTGRCVVSLSFLWYPWIPCHFQFIIIVSFLGVYIVHSLQVCASQFPLLHINDRLVLHSGLVFWWIECLCFRHILSLVWRYIWFGLSCICWAWNIFMFWFHIYRLLVPRMFLEWGILYLQLFYSWRFWLCLSLLHFWQSSFIFLGRSHSVVQSFWSPWHSPCIVIIISTLLFQFRVQLLFRICSCAVYFLGELVFLSY